MKCFLRWYVYAHPLHIIALSHMAPLSFFLFSSLPPFFTLLSTLSHSLSLPPSLPLSCPSFVPLSFLPPSLPLSCPYCPFPRPLLGSDRRRRHSSSSEGEEKEDERHKSRRRREREEHSDTRRAEKLDVSVSTLPFPAIPYPSTSYPPPSLHPSISDISSYMERKHE